MADCTDTFVPSAPRAELLIYASKSATRCSSEGEPAGLGEAVCPRADDVMGNKIATEMIERTIQQLILRIRDSSSGAAQTSQGRNISLQFCSCISTNLLFQIWDDLIPMVGTGSSPGLNGTFTKHSADASYNFHFALAQWLQSDWLTNSAHESSSA